MVNIFSVNERDVWCQTDSIHVLLRNVRQTQSYNYNIEIVSILKTQIYHPNQIGHITV